MEESMKKPETSEMPVVSEAEPVIASDQPEAEKVAEKGRAEPNEAFFGSLLLFCLVLSLISATGYFGFSGYRYFKQVQAEKAIPSIDALPKAEVAESAPEAPASAEKEIAVTPDPSSEAVVAVDKKTLSIKVLNGGAAKGVAGTYAEKLKTAGFSKTVVGNAFGDYAGQTLYYAKGQSAGADVIKAEVAKTYSALSLKEAPAGDKDAGAATYVLILGR
jgi:hypothetical protein